MTGRPGARIVVTGPGAHQEFEFVAEDESPLCLRRWCPLMKDHLPPVVDGLPDRAPERMPRFLGAFVSKMSR
jgi:hypothetical protein